MIAIAAILGLVEGLTEFIPVSSTGHLILVGKLLNFEGEFAATFEIFIQLGAILAVVAFYLKRFLGLLSFKKGYGLSGYNGIMLLILTTLPALVVGLAAHSFIKKYLFTPGTVAAGLIMGSLWILATERMKPRARKAGLDSLTWKDSFYIGVFQCLAMWPGVSRSASTILGGIMLGLDRKTAAEYSFFAAVPVLAAAVILDLYKSLPLLKTADIPFFGVGFVVAFISAWFVVKFFIAYVSKYSLSVFAWYRLAIAALVLLLMGVV